jgi:hypothetical protein
MKRTKMTTLEVVILDDEKNVEEAIRSKLPKAIAANAQVIKPEKIVALVKELGGRMAAARRKTTFEMKRTDVDGIDLFIVDYDLVEAKNEDYLTGETVAYLARCYSTCGVIVGLNQYWRQPTFDLTLRQQLDSFADLNISANDLNNPGLWQEAPLKGYRPWSWPVIVNLVSLMRRRVVDVEKTEIDTHVVDFLGFPRSVVERLPASSLEMLGSSSKRAEAATLKDVLKSPILGLRGREASERRRLPSQDARIIAARLTTWLNAILAPQDVLVDGPHLAERCPSVVSGVDDSKTTVRDHKPSSRRTCLQGQESGQGEAKKDILVRSAHLVLDGD